MSPEGHSWAGRLCLPYMRSENGGETWGKRSGGCGDLVETLIGQNLRREPPPMARSRLAASWCHRGTNEGRLTLSARPEPPIGQLRSAVRVHSHLKGCTVFLAQSMEQSCGGIIHNLRFGSLSLHFPAVSPTKPRTPSTRTMALARPGRCPLLLEPCCAVTPVLTRDRTGV